MNYRDYEYGDGQSVKTGIDMSTDEFYALAKDFPKDMRDFLGIKNISIISADSFSLLGEEIDNLYRQKKAWEQNVDHVIAYRFGRNDIEARVLERTDGYIFTLPKSWRAKLNTVCDNAWFGDVYGFKIVPYSSELEDFLYNIKTGLNKWFKNLDKHITEERVLELAKNARGLSEDVAMKLIWGFRSGNR